MVQNYLKLAFRNLLKNRLFSALNITGWALGMAACIMMLLFVQHEWSFDRMHSKASRIFRLTELTSAPGRSPEHVPLSMYPMADAFLKDYAEIETAVRVGDHEPVVLKSGSRQIIVKKLLTADSTFFDVFDFEGLRGDVKKALRNRNGIVLTAETAQRIFNTDDAVGKTLEVNRGAEAKPFTVTAVLHDLPETSHLQFEALIPLQELVPDMQEWQKSWDANWLVTYLLFRENSRPEKVAADLDNFVKRYLPAQHDRYDLALQPLAQVHLGSTHIVHDNLNDRKFDGRYVGIFGWLAIFVLLIASFNFINLTIARSTQRVKEVGIRKAVGAQKGQLIAQFSGEAVLTALCALALALVLVKTGLPALKKVIDRDLEWSLFSDPCLLPALLGFTVLIGLLSGIYPALAAAAFKPVSALKGAVANPSKNNFSLRSGLVVLQFSIAISLVIATLLAVRQLDFIRGKKLGFDTAQIVQIPMNKTANKNYEALRAALLQTPAVLGVAASGQRLGNNLSPMGIRAKINGEERSLVVSQLMVDYQYLDFYGIQLPAGRGFSKAFAQDAGHSFVINEAFARELGLENPVGQPMRTGWQAAWGTIIGVSKDFNFNSLHHKVAPLAISIQPWNFSEMSVRIAPQNTAESLRALETIWQKFVPDLPFSYEFLDEHFAALYKTDTEVSQVVSICTFLAILIACLGLFGLATFVVELRTKEIGVRKVLGASIAGIAGLLAKDFLKLVVIAIAIASPIAYYFMNLWLADFAYRIDIQWWMFAAAGAAAVLIALLTVGFQSVRAALANPVQSLRSE